MRMPRIAAACAIIVAAALLPTAPGPAAGKKAKPPLRARLAPIDLAHPQIPAWALRPGRLIDVGGYRLNLYCMGTGGPTVVMFSGGGWGAIAFSQIQPVLAEHGRVCSYDRAGQGFSDVGPLKPTPDQAIRDVTTLLSKAGEKGPFVLVGWSLGGMEARQFAADHPERVAGIVTIDGSSFDEDPLTGTEDYHVASLKLVSACARDAHAGVLRRDPARLRDCARVVNPLDALPPMRAAIGDRVLSPDAYDLALYNLEHQPDVFARLRATRRPLGAVPLRVLLASSHVVKDGPEADAPIPDPRFVQFAVKVAGYSSDGRVIILPGTDHPIHFKRPADVVEVVEEVVDRARETY